MAKKKTKASPRIQIQQIGEDKTLFTVGNTKELADLLTAAAIGDWHFKDAFDLATLQIREAEAQTKS